MFLGLGSAAYGAGIFHLMTHAFFKALLFLGAGSVIHALHEEQDIRKMGGLRRQLPITFATFLVATLAIAGLPGLSGFFSKDEILAAAFLHHKLLWVIGVFTAALTSFYMFRLLFLTFFGESRLSAERIAHVHESPLVMTLPLALLALLSIAGGWLGLPPVLGPHLLGGVEGGFLGPVFADLHQLAAGSGAAGHGGHLGPGAEWALMGLSTLMALAGFLAAWLRYARPAALGDLHAAPASVWQRLLADKYRVDELYDAVIVRPLAALAQFLWRWIDEILIDGLVNFTGLAVRVGGEVLRLFQTGYVQTYAFFMVLGVIALLLRLLA
jgi:NADH-quinone oxidoreductase subunit L